MYECRFTLYSFQGAILSYQGPFDNGPSKVDSDDNVKVNSGCPDSHGTRLALQVIDFCLSARVFE